MIKSIEVAWLAGLLEGDGYFGQTKECPIIKIEMTSKDTIIRVANLVGSNIWHRKNIWGTAICGARSVALMMTLYTLLGKRRKNTVLGIINRWKNRYTRAPNGFRAMAKCHPDRVVEAFGLCSYCYHHKKYVEKSKLLRKVG